MLRTALAATALLLSAATVQAADKPIRIAILNDLSSIYADYQGIGSVIAARMAVEDYGGKAAGRPVEVIQGDHQNKPDIGSALARRWFDTEGVDAILDVPNSAVALAVHEIAREKNKVLIGSGAGTAELTGPRCSPNTVHWTYDAWAMASGVARAAIEQGGKKWFFITSDYAFGHDLERNAREVVTARGGEVVGAVRHPFGAADFASFLLQAQASGADVIGLATPGGDLTTELKQAAEFNMSDKQKLVGLIVATNNVDAVGLASAQGLMAVNAFYWDMNDQTRAWSNRFVKLHPRGNMPNDMQAGVYSAVLHYLKALDKLGKPEDGRAVVEAMKALPTDDPLFGKGRIRADGRKIHPMLVLETKPVKDSKGPWDYFRVTGAIPAEEAFRPLAAGNCPLAR